MKRKKKMKNLSGSTTSQLYVYLFADRSMSLFAEGYKKCPRKNMAYKKSHSENFWRHLLRLCLCLLHLPLHILSV